MLAVYATRTSNDGSIDSKDCSHLSYPFANRSRTICIDFAQMYSGLRWRQERSRRWKADAMINGVTAAR